MENKESTAVKGAIADLIRKYFDAKTTPQDKATIPRIPLSAPSYGSREVIEALDSLLEGSVTMGKKVKIFEERFAEYIGVRNAIMVNSGSSANLLALSVMSNSSIRNGITRGDEVITPAVTWSTTVFPIVGAGAIPVFVDVNLDTYTIDVSQMEKAVTDRTKALSIVHLLGSPCEMKPIQETAESHDLIILEDSCEALGAEDDDAKVGSFGMCSTFSFYFSHHITTMEGGMLVTNDDELGELARVMRAHGWIRELRDKSEIKKKHPDIDPRFLFINQGYNLRPMEIQGAFGMHQMERLEEFIHIRQTNARYWNDRLGELANAFILPRERTRSRHTWFSYPITVSPDAPFSKVELMNFLENSGVETRPVMTGNITRQPVINSFRHKVRGRLDNSNLIMDHSFLIGNHHGIGKEEREYVADLIVSFVKRRST